MFPPLLAHQADVGSLLGGGERITRVALHDDYLALGTESGHM
jgi:hypothetical protein